MRVLYVEDEKKVADLVKDALERENYSVVTASDGEQGETLALSGHFDLVILDILIPKKDGLEVLRNLRAKKHSTPILLLTAKTSVQDKVKGLDEGADDYLTKPFAITELLARVRSLIRRGGSSPTAALRVGDVVLDPLTRRVRRGNKAIDLTTKEYALLEYFMRNKDKVLSRSVISEHIWGYNFDTGTNIVDVYINHLRNKIDGESEKKLFHTIRGIGYVMKETDDSSRSLPVDDPSDWKTHRG
jgi:DNA-binding response OmpR family regulator